MILLIVVLVNFLASSKGFPSDLDYSSKMNNGVPKLKWSFSVELNQPLNENEKIGITGDADFLGSWSPSKALFLNRTNSPTRWSGSVWFAANTLVTYRFFIGLVDSNGGVQIRSWETHLEGRTVKLGAENIGTTDRFGIVQGKKEIERGWLNSGNILQFKLFHNAIRLNGFDEDQRIYVKVTPVEYDWSAREKLLTPILAYERAHIEYIRMEYGNSKIRDQTQYGVPYEMNDIVIFHITTDDLKNIAYKFTIYGDDERNPDIQHTLAYQYFFPDIIDGTDGYTELVLLSTDGSYSIGIIKIGYLLIKPLSGNQLNFRTSFKQYWRKNWRALDAGHRGLGDSLELIIGAAPLIENTVASLKEAGVQGADMVEFDVQLTRDLIPIIYHDFVVYVSKNVKKPTNKDDLTEVLIKDLTYEQLKALKTYQIVDSQVIEYRSHNMERREDYRLFPLFEDFLTKVDHLIGFDIEIKWPQLESNGKFESIQTIDKNVYVDRILDVMMQKGCGRLSFFTSLDADICTMVQLKQNMYPVMFLGPMTENFYYDPRSDNLEQTINNAMAMELLGIVPHTSNFIEDGSRMMNLALDLDLKVFIWGNDSNSLESVDYFKSLGPTGVIYDRVDRIIPDGKENVFSQEQDLPEFFKKQCPSKKGF